MEKYTWSAGKLPNLPAGGQAFTLLAQYTQVNHPRFAVSSGDFTPEATPVGKSSGLTASNPSSANCGDCCENRLPTDQRRVESDAGTLDAVGDSWVCCAAASSRNLTYSSNLRLWVSIYVSFSSWGRLGSWKEDPIKDDAEKSFAPEVSVVEGANNDRRKLYARFGGGVGGRGGGA